MRIVRKRLARVTAIVAAAGLAALSAGAAGCGAHRAAPPPAVAATTVSDAPAPASGDTEGKLRWAIAGRHRTEADKVRDGYRHPFETLTFFGLEDDANVVELWPGGGWYTAILAPVLRDRGHLAVVVPHDLAPAYRARLLDRAPAIFDAVEVRDADLAPPVVDLVFGPDASADVVLTFDNLHAWMAGGYVERVFAAAFRVLKPGGTLGLVDHRAPPAASPREGAQTGYVPVPYVAALASTAGFTFDGTSEINANPRDTKDHPNGVWSLPPVLRGGAADRDRFLAVGESDRMTLRFKKPVAVR